MKLLKIVTKNLKIIFRNKASALSVVLGPIIVVILVTLAFNRSISYDLSIGLVGNADMQIYQDLESSLRSNGYGVMHYNNLQSCINNINYGITHVCINIPQDFSIENGNNTLDFYLDQSRVNLFWSVINSISSVIELESSELSEQLISNLLSILDEAKSTSQQQINSLDRVKQDLTNIKLTLQTNKESLDSLDLNEISLDFNSLYNYIDNSSDSLSNEIDTIIADLQATIDDTNASADARSLASSTKNSLEDLQDSVRARFNEVRSNLESLSSQANNLNKKLNTAKTTVSAVSDEMSNMISTLEDTINLISQIQDELQSIVDSVDSIKVKSSERIANPIVTQLNTVTSENSQIAYMIPYLLILFVMMISVLLASTLVVIDRNSKAFFRTFTTPTKPFNFFISYYLTSLLLVFIQTFVMILIGYYFVGSLIFSNFHLVLLLLFLAATLFIVLGIGIGTIIRSQEGVTITSLSITITMLLLSNFVLPLETMNVNIRKIAFYNPYVISSEIFRRVMFFKSSFLQEYKLLSILLVEMIVIIVLTFLLHKLSIVSYFRKSKYLKSLTNNSFHILKLKDGTIIRNKEELVAYLNNLSDKEFKTFVKRYRKDLEGFIRTALKDEDLWEKIKEGKRP